MGSFWNSVGSALSTAGSGIVSAAKWLTSTDDLSAARDGQLKYTGTLEEHVTDNTKVLDAGRWVSRDLVKHRFHKGNQYGAEFDSSIFNIGYEDPAFLTFKLEFGGWGYSLFDKEEEIKNLQISDKFTNIHLADYDLMPMGLLNLDFKLYNNQTNWNQLTSYNTYNYLMNVNQDVRAAWIKDFTEGILLLQNKMPYIFLKVTGLDKLEELVATQGRRLKEAELEITCLEGVDMKIKTLLMLYRKAVYDEEWQRWVVPDIYRYFKLIIYVFDKRILKTGWGDYSIELDNFPIMAYECGPCEIDINNSIFESEYSANYNDLHEASTTIKIKVHNVRTFYANQLFKHTSYIADLFTPTQISHTSGEYLSAHIDYRSRWLKNMFMKYSEYLAYHAQETINSVDMIDNELQHRVGDESDYDLLLENKEAHMPNEVDNTWHEATVSDEAIVIDSWNSFTRALKTIFLSNTRLVRDSRYADRSYFQNDMWRPNLEFTPTRDGLDMSYKMEINDAKYDLTEHLKNMVQNMTDNYYIPDDGSTLLLRYVKDPVDISLNLRKTDFHLNKYSFIGEEIPQFNFIKPLNDVSRVVFNVEKIHDPMIPMEINPLEKNKMRDVSLIFNDEVEHAPMIEPVFNDLVVHAPMVEPIFNDEVEHAPMVEPIFNDEKNHAPMVEPIFNDEVEHAPMVKPEENLDINHSPMVEPIFNLDKQKENMVTYTENLDKPEMEYVTPVYNTSIVHGPMVEPIFNTSISHAPMVEPIFNVSVNHSPMVTPEENLDKPDVSLVKPIETKAANHLNMVYIEAKDLSTNIPMVTPEFNDLKNHSPMVEPEIDTHKGDMTYVEPDFNLDKPSMTYTKPTENLDKHKIPYVEPILDTHKNHVQLIPTEQYLDKSQQNLVDPILNLEKPNIELVEPELNILKNHSPYVKPEQYIDKPKSNLVDPKLNLDKPNFDLVNPILNLEIPEGTFVKPQLNLDKNESNLVEPIINEEHKEFPYVDPILNTEHHNFPYVDPILNVEKSNIPFAEPYKNLEKANFEYVEPLKNLEKSELTLTPTELNLNKAELNLTTPKLDTSIASLKFTELLPEKEIPELKYTELLPAKEPADLKYTELLPAKEPADLKYTELLPEKEAPIQNYTLLLPEKEPALLTFMTPNLETNLPDLKMTTPEEPKENAPQVMQEPILNLEHGNQVMQEPIENLNHIKTPMTKPILNLDRINTDYVEPIMNTDVPATPMTTPVENLLKSNLNLQYNKPQDNDKYKDGLYHPMVSNKPEVLENPLQEMIAIIKDPQLASKVLSLISLNTDDFKDTPLKDLISLALIMEHTIDEIKERTKNMKLTDNHPHIPKHVHLKMTRIEQPSRKLYDTNKFMKVDEAAKRRALKARNDAKDKDKHTNTAY